MVGSGVGLEGELVCAPFRYVILEVEVSSLLVNSEHEADT